MPLGDRDDYGDAKYVGLELGGVASLAESLKVGAAPGPHKLGNGCELRSVCIRTATTRIAQTHGQQGFDFVLAPLAGERATRAPDLHPGVPHLPPSYHLLGRWWPSLQTR